LYEIYVDFTVAYESVSTDNKSMCVVLYKVHNYGSVFSTRLLCQLYYTVGI